MPSNAWSLKMPQQIPHWSTRFVRESCVGGRANNLGEILTKSLMFPKHIYLVCIGCWYATVQASIGRCCQVLQGRSRSRHGKNTLQEIDLMFHDKPFFFLIRISLTISLCFMPWYRTRSQWTLEQKSPRLYRDMSRPKLTHGCHLILKQRLPRGAKSSRCVEILYSDVVWWTDVCVCFSDNLNFHQLSIITIAL